jgi:hypothetical protein
MRSAQFLDNLNGAVRDNPLAAGLIGMGLAWIILDRSGGVVRDTSRMARGAKRAIDTTLGAATDTVSGAVDQVGKAAAGVSDTISEGLQAAGSTIRDAVEGGWKTSGQGSDMHSEFARHFPSLSSNRLADLLNRQPLALAAVGVAVGAAIASALPPTAAEDRLMGAAGDKVKGALSDATGAVAEKAGTVIEEAADEAVAQNLTPGAVKEAARAGAAKLKTVADAGLNALEK